MADKKKNKKTAAPSGCSITRAGNKFTLTWKIKAKDTKDGQKRRHIINGKKSSPVAINKKATKTSITTTKYPLKTVTIQIQDNQKEDKKGASNWAGATFKFKKPPSSTCGISLSSDFWNVCNISYGHNGSAFSNSDHIGYIHTERQTRFFKQGTKDTDATKKWKKNDGTSGTDFLTKESGSFSKQEYSLTLSKKDAYVRQFRFRIKGKKGYNRWKTCSHYYSIPYAATIKSAKISDGTGGTGMDCRVQWYSPDDDWHPIDYTVLQYGIAIPGINLACPGDISWTDRPAMKDTKTTKTKKGKTEIVNKKEDGDVFHIDTILDPDYCFFVRVKNIHDNNVSYSKPTRASGLITKLSNPLFRSILPDYTTFRVLINAENTSQVPDSSIAVIFKSTKDGESKEQIIGIIPNGVSETTVQCPNLNELEDFSFGVQAFVGDAGSYILTEDTSVVSNKKYYTRTGSEEDIATIVENPSGNPHEEGYYEQYDDGGYFLSEDVEVNPNSTYYTIIPATPYEYTAVSNPSGNPHELGYFEFIPNVSSDVSYEYEGQTLTYSVYEIPNIKMQSSVIWQGGDVPRPPANVKAVTVRENVALVTWDWAWKSADIAELSWSDHEDAWESTNQPETYRIENTHSGKWSIYGLEAGVTWYIKVRLIKTTEDGENQGPWGSADPLDMSSAPNKPNLDCSRTAVSMTDSFTLSWDYISTDGTDQIKAMLTNVSRQNDGTIVEGEDLNIGITTERSIDLTPSDEVLNWSTGEEHGFVVSVTSESGKISEKSDPVWITVADPIECVVTNTSFKVRYLYTLTDDTEVNENQQYYTLVGTVVASPNINDISTYYELTGGIYDLTTDGIIDEESVYYTVVGTLVNNPQGNPHELNYYIRTEINILDKLPLDIETTVTGGSETGTDATIVIERALPYFVDRPDETTYQGYEGETIFSQSYDSISNVTITQENLVGYLDDTAFYHLTIFVYDDLGQETVTEPILFMVNWEHQATVPNATVEFDPGYSVMKITPYIDPTKYREGDTFDIYRLSIDKPVLIVKGGSYEATPVTDPTGNPHENEYCEKNGDSYYISEDTEVDPEKTYYIVGVGKTYVDPYPTIGRYGGHRVVTVTANGDFISNDEESDMAWIDLDEDDGDIFYSDFSIINYKEGIFQILYNADLSTDWHKDFRETKYLGGHIQGDWNDGVSRTSTINSVMLREEDFVSIQDFRRLAEFTGVCHIRTLDGSNYYADIQVNESIPYDENPLNTYSFKITRVDSDGYDGIELSEWNKLIGG